MTSPSDQANGTTKIKTASPHKDFEAITITGFYTRDIRFPVHPVPLVTFESCD